MNKRYLVVFEIGKTGVGAFAPDIPGCFAVGPSIDEARQRYLEAVDSHLKWMCNENDPMPQPVTSVYDFAPEGDEEVSSYFVEWLTIPVPVEKRHAISA